MGRTFGLTNVASVPDLLLSKPWPRQPGFCPYSISQEVGSLSEKSRPDRRQDAGVLSRLCGWALVRTDRRRREHPPSTPNSPNNPARCPIPPILVPILKVRSPAHDGGRLRMKTPPRARTGPRWVSSASARATSLAPDLFRQRVVPLGRERASKSGTKRLASWQFCFEAFQPAGDPDGAEVARTTIPEQAIPESARPSRRWALSRKIGSKVSPNLTAAPASPASAARS